MGPTAHNEENPTSLFFGTEDTWKYHAERPAVEQTINLPSHLISLTFRRLFEISECSALLSRPKSKTNLTTLYGLFYRLLGEEAY
jgi:hypothetical protein